MIIQKRNQKMFMMRDKGATFEEISKKYKLSSERVRQIITNEPNFCVQHSYHFLNKCPYCNLENEYKEELSKLSLVELTNEGKRLSKLGRTRLEIIKKRIFIRTIRDNFGYAFTSIGRLLKRDHTSVMGLYY